MKIKFVTQEGEYAQLHQRIIQINADLAELTGQQTHPSEVQVSKKTKSLPEAYDLVRQYTMSLYGVFQKRFQEAPACACATAHVINLRLQSIDDKNGRATGAVRFKVIFSYDMKTAMISREPWDCNDPVLPIEAAKLLALPSLKLQPASAIEPSHSTRQYMKRIGGRVSSIFSSKKRLAVSTTPVNHAPESG